MGRGGERELRNRMKKPFMNLKVTFEKALISLPWLFFCF